MRLAGVEANHHPFPIQVHLHILDAANFQQHRAEFTNAFVAVFAFGCDFDPFNNGMVCLLVAKGAGWIGIVRASGVHLFNLTKRGSL